MKESARTELLQKVKLYCSVPKPPSVIELAKKLDVPRSTAGRWRQQFFEGTITVKADISSRKEQLQKKRDFYSNPVIENFKNLCIVDKKNPQRYISPLFRMCNLLTVKPDEFLVDKQQCESLFTKFETEWAKLHPNKTTERYSKALRKFASYHKDKVDISESVAIPGGSESKGDYATVHFSDEEFTKGLQFMETEYGWEAAVLFAVFHEIFPRPEAAFAWIPEIEIKYSDVNHKAYEYATANIYEPKQKKYYEKLILDPRVLSMVKDLSTTKPLVPKENRDDVEHFMSEALRDFYYSIGKIEKDTVYEKGQPGWLYLNRPIYTERHSSATMWVRRTNFNFSLVASMGWEDPKTLMKYYARNTTSSIMEAGICYFCRPPSVLTNKAVFCSAPHACAYLHKLYGDSI